MLAAVYLFAIVAPLVILVVGLVTNRAEQTRTGEVLDRPRRGRPRRSRPRYVSRRRGDGPRTDMFGDSLVAASPAPTSLAPAAPSRMARPVLPVTASVSHDMGTFPQAGGRASVLTMYAPSR